MKETRTNEELEKNLALNRILPCAKTGPAQTEVLSRKFEHHAKEPSSDSSFRPPSEARCF